MIRLEIICNKAIEEDIIDVLTAYGFGESYTYISPIYGRGRHGRREGSPVWPEENILFLLMLEEEQAGPIIADLKKEKQKFPDEGLRCYAQRDIHRLL